MLFQFAHTISRSYILNRCFFFLHMSEKDENLTTMVHSMRCSFKSQYYYYGGLELYEDIVYHHCRFKNIFRKLGLLCRNMSNHRIDRKNRVERNSYFMANNANKR